MFSIGRVVYTPYRVGNLLRSMDILELSEVPRCNWNVYIHVHVRNYGRWGIDGHPVTIWSATVTTYSIQDTLKVILNEIDKYPTVRSVWRYILDSLSFDATFHG